MNDKTPFGCLVLLIAALTLSGRTAIADPLPPIAQKAIPVIASADVANGLDSLWRPSPADVDDGFAIGMTHHDPGYDLKGVVVIFGNSKVVEETAVAKNIMGPLLKTTVPVFQGAEGLLGDVDKGENQFGPRYPYNDPKCINAGVTFMAETLATTPGTLILATGPLTDVACLAYHFPATHAAIKEVAVIMGRAQNENFELNGATGLTDFNYARDPASVKYLLADTHIPMAFMAFSLTSSSFLPKLRIDALKPNPSSAAQFFYRSSQVWIEYWDSLFGQTGFHPWDQNAVFYALNPAAFTCDAHAHFNIIPCDGEPNHNAPNNACAGHGPTQKASLNAETSQLQFDSSFQSRAVTYCSAYASAASKQAFLDALLLFITE